MSSNSSKDQSFKVRQKEHFDTIAATYSEKIDQRSYDYYSTFTFHSLESILKRYFVDLEGLHGLDLGCGNGDFTNSMGRLCRSMHGVDLSEGMIAEAKRHYPSPNLEFVAQPSDDLPFPDSKFDFCFSLHLFHHLITPENIIKTIAQMKRVTRDKGLVIILDTNKLNPLSYFAQYLMTKRNVDTGDEKLVAPSVLIDEFNNQALELFSYKPSCCVPHITPWLKSLNATLESSFLGRWIAKDYLIAGIVHK